MAIKLAAPISIQSLVATRILFGAIMVWDCWRYIRYERIERYYVQTELTFPYFGLDFLQPLPEPWIHWAWLMTGVTAFLMMIGLFYRAAAIGFILSFGYFFLLDRTQYLNHHYMVLIYGFLLALMPANRAWSIDAMIWPRIRSLTIPAWPVTALRLQTEIILIYAGIVKINDDWLRGEPLRMWMHDRVDDVWIAPIFQYDWILMAAALGTIVLHIVGAPLLLWSKTRLWVFLIYCCFHVSNSVFFNIGIFPWLTIAATLIFFAPDWPHRLARNALSVFEPMRPLPSLPPLAAPRPGPVLIAALAVWFAVQLYLPMRQAFFPNLVGWTGDGHRFSWRMRIYSRRGEGYFEITTADGLTSWYIDPIEYLSGRQASNVLTRPDLVYDFAQILKEKWAADGHADVTIHAHIQKSFNGRPAQTYINPEVDLATAEYNLFAPDDWIMPLERRAAEGVIANWWPPLPLQRPDPVQVVSAVGRKKSGS